MIEAKNPIRILIVEDDESIRSVLNDLLTTDKTELFLAPDGESAVPYLEAGQIDLLITDLGLPGMSGWEVAITAKRYLSDLRIVAITSWRGPEVEQRLAESDLDAVIWKPFKLKHVCETLDHIIPGFIKNCQITVS
ncbi:MAG: response regulator [FCB group bacterium]|nr:response regulator [FCB group bacterium]